MVTLAVAMGLGRFAFTPMLPIMLHEGKLELAGGGVLASLNYLGYFLGAVSCAAIGIKASSMVRGGLAATAACWSAWACCTASRAGASCARRRA
jgi:hypothetical protein